jgi:hypothetical protein
MKKYKKLQIVLSLTRDYCRMAEMGWKVFTFGIFKIHSFPDSGMTLGPKDYRGFIIKFMIWLPFDSYR